MSETFTSTTHNNSLLSTETDTVDVYDLDSEFGPIVLSTISALILVILLPISCYYGIKFWAYRHHIVIIKRYGTLTLHHAFILILHFIVLAVASLLLSGVINADRPVVLLFSWFELFVSLATCWIPMLRFWHLWLDMKYMSKLMTHQWIHIIGDTNINIKENDSNSSNTRSKGSNFKNYKISTLSIEDNQSNGSVASHRGEADSKLHNASLERSIFANYRVTCYFLVYPMLVLIPSLVESHLVPIDIVIAVLFASYIIPFAVIIYLYMQLKCKLKFEDSFGVGAELHRLFWINFLCVVWIILSLVTVTVVVEEIDTNYEPQIWTIWVCVLVLFLALVTFLEILSVTKWVLKRIKPLLDSKHFIHGSRRSTRTGTSLKENAIQTDQFVEV